MNSLSFIGTRTQATWAAQVSIATLWLWNLKTILQWSDDVTLLDQLNQAEGAKRTAWRNAAALWDVSLADIHDITRLMVVQAVNKYANDPVKLKPFQLLRTDARSRQDIYDQGFDAYHEWQNADAAWTVTRGTVEVTLGTLGSLLSAAVAQRGTYRTKLTDWRKAAGTLMHKARKVDAENVAWYAEATRRFQAGTVEGDLIRSTVPTTYTPPPEVGPAQITTVMVSGTEIHADATALHATKFTWFHQAPGSPAFLVIATGAPGSLTLHNQPPGVHRLKAVGANSGGEGAPSAAVEVTIAQQQAA